MESDIMMVTRAQEDKYMIQIYSNRVERIRTAAWILAKRGVDVESFRLTLEATVKVPDTLSYLNYLCDAYEQAVRLTPALTNDKNLL